MHIKLCTFPMMVRKSDVLDICPAFADFVRRNGIVLEWTRWDGYLKSLPHQPAFVFASCCNDVPRTQVPFRITMLGHLWIENEDLPVGMSAEESAELIGETIEERLTAFVRHYHPHFILREREQVAAPPSCVA